MGSLLVTFGAQVRPSEVSKASWRLILIKNDDSQLFARVPSQKLNIDPQDAPRGAPDPPKTPQEAPKTPPRGFQDATFSLLNFDRHPKGRSVSKRISKLSSNSSNSKSQARPRAVRRTRVLNSKFGPKSIQKSIKISVSFWSRF